MLLIRQRNGEAGVAAEMYATQRFLVEALEKDCLRSNTK